MKRGFLHNKPDLFRISKARLVYGITLGLLSAFIFYSFLYLFREVIRIFSITEDFNIWVLTDSEVNFYNLFFAYLAVIAGQAVCIRFLLDKPRKLFTKQKRYWNTAIIHDQRFLYIYFLNWFAKLAVLYALFFGVTFDNAFYAFSFYPKYNYLFILIILVLFLQSFTSIRRIFRNSLKYLLLSAIVLSALAFGLSRINLLDY